MKLSAQVQQRVSKRSHPIASATLASAENLNETWRIHGTSPYSSRPIEIELNCHSQVSVI
jgi:hypothetical protein